MHGVTQAGGGGAGTQGGVSTDEPVNNSWKPSAVKDTLDRSSTCWLGTCIYSAADTMGTTLVHLNNAPVAADNGAGRGAMEVGGGGAAAREVKGVCGRV